MASSHRRGSDEMPVSGDNILVSTLEFPAGRKCKTPAGRSRIKSGVEPGRPNGGKASPLPYIVAYKITGEVIYVVHTLHGAQKWL